MSIKSDLTRFVHSIDTRVSTFLSAEPAFKDAQARARQQLTVELQKYVATQQAIADAAAHEVAHVNGLIQKLNGGTLPSNIQAPSGTIRVVVEEAKAVEGAAAAIKMHWKWALWLLVSCTLIFLVIHTH